MTRRSPALKSTSRSQRSGTSMSKCSPLFFGASVRTVAVFPRTSTSVRTFSAAIVLFVHQLTRILSS
ncbi:MAG: hypothetical protein DMF86_14325 [Acidobacteria bacterium]|nr:MAG: hypothetical protein DMF86_14325 [Acidobacteriota bacterium]